MSRAWGANHRYSGRGDLTPVEAMLEILRDEGVTKIFGNPGTTELPLLDALAKAPDLEYVLAVQEASAVAMADGYARATGRPAFVSLHIAAGLANGLIGLLNAKRSRTPLVVTAGQQDRRHLVEDPMLGGDLVALAQAACKQAVEVRQARDLPVVLRRAFALAATPPEGPVFVSIPMDVLREETEVPVPARSLVAPLGPAMMADQAAGILAAAERPAIVAGDGVGRSGAVAELVDLAERIDATVFHHPMHDRLNFPFTHPLHAGMIPPRNASVREALDGHDVVFVVGAHAFSPHHFTPGPPIPPGTRVVQLDDDPAELGRNFPVELGLSGGIKPTLAELVELVGFVARTNRERRPADRTVPEAATAPLEPAVAARAIADGLPPHAVVLDEAITVGVLLRPLLRLDRPGSFVHTIGGGLGWGFGSAVGTRMAQDRPVVAVLGDGCAMFGLQGLWSAARYQVPVLFLIMNNGEYRALNDMLGESYGPGPHGGTELGELDWTRAAEFFGVAARRVDSDADLRVLVASVGSLQGPLLVDVPLR
ncbi:thiamine pyrophosphate-binding protein [Actinophytocola sp.]|uniref:thiamine pyrophosphate-binding protein n=1 Tax=Actinophytocola sp. TaxID=1872138 RepID=UPI002D294468|nr:thiamine pyrophosphate-binding protein [Actinophytocola sp.]HYQ66283.1 thiamine pyrophosphate-binding protein [Actinophytocola sp.]